MTPWGAPKPVLRYHPGDLWIEFPFTAEYLKAIAAGKGETTGVKTRVETGVKSSVKILQLISENADITTPELATALHLTQRAIEKNCQVARYWPHPSYRPGQGRPLGSFTGHKEETMTATIAGTRWTG